MDPLNNLQFSDTQTRERLIRLRSDCETAERNVREFEKVVSDEKAVGEELRADLKEQTKEINHIEHGVTRTFQQINYVKAIRSEISKRSTASPSPSAFDPQAFSDELAMIKTTIAQSKINIEELRREVEEKTRLAVEQRLEEREKELADQISVAESKYEVYKKKHEAIENEAQEASTRKHTLSADIDQAKIDIRIMHERHPAEEKEREIQADDMMRDAFAQQEELVAAEAELKILVEKNSVFAGPMKERDELLASLTKSNEANNSLKNDNFKLGKEGKSLGTKLRAMKKAAKEVTRKNKNAKTKNAKDQEKNREKDEQVKKVLVVEKKREVGFREELKGFAEDESKGEIRLVKELNKKTEDAIEGTEGIVTDLTDGKEDVMEVEMELREIRLEIHTEYGDWGDEMGELQATEVKLEELIEAETVLDEGVKRMEVIEKEDGEMEKKLGGELEVWTECVGLVNKAIKFENLAAKSEKQALIEEAKLKNVNKPTGGLRRSSSNKRRRSKNP